MLLSVVYNTTMYDPMIFIGNTTHNVYDPVTAKWYPHSYSFSANYIGTRDHQSITHVCPTGYFDICGCCGGGDCGAPMCGCTVSTSECTSCLDSCPTNPDDIRRYGYDINLLSTSNSNHYHISSEFFTFEFRI